MAAQDVRYYLLLYCKTKLITCSPFNDMENLTDPSTADITSRVLELCKLIIRNANAPQGDRQQISYDAHNRRFQVPSVSLRVHKRLMGPGGHAGG